MADDERQDSSDFGRLLRRFRLAAGLSQEVLAERAHLSANGIGALERGYRHAPQRETLVLIVRALQLDERQRHDLEIAAGSRRAAVRGSTSNLQGSDVAAILPLSLTSFIGRECELGAITGLVREHRLVTITGAGGIGKTQTALRAAASSEAGRISDVRFIGLAPLTDPALVVSAIAASIGVKEVLHQPLLETVVASLRNHPLLLILDNCEHVIAEAARLAEVLLTSCPELRILATSREPLHSAGEHTYRLPSLAHDDAVALFVARGRAADHCFVLVDANAAAVGEICRRLDGIPLAIELAAARVNTLSVKALSERLANHLPALGSGARTAAPRQQTMAAAINWSYDLLCSQEQRVFERLSVFAGGCTLELAAPVCADEGDAEDGVLDLLMSLVDKSLLVVDLDRDEPRYALLEPFKQYAGEKLAARHDEQSTHRRHADAFLALAEELERDFDSAASRVRQALQEELGNWRAVLQWTLTERGAKIIGQQLAGRLSALWTMIPMEGRRWVAAAQALSDDDMPVRVRAALNFADAESARSLREFERQLASGRRALIDFQAVADLVGTANAQSLLCAALINLRRTNEAKALIRRTLSLAKRTGSRHLIAYAYRCLAFVIGLQRPAARRCLAKALRLYESSSDQLLCASVLSELGGFEVIGGDPELGLAHLREALGLHQQCNNIVGVTRDLGELAFNLIELSRYDEAKEYAREALEVARRQHLEYEILVNLDFLLAIAVLRSKLPEASLDRWAGAARTLGYVDARLTLLGSARNDDVQRLYKNVIAALGEAFVFDRLAGLMAEGAAMNEKEAVEAALSAAAATR